MLVGILFCCCIVCAAVISAKSTAQTYAGKIFHERDLRDGVAYRIFLHEGMNRIFSRLRVIQIRIALEVYLFRVGIGYRHMAVEHGRYVYIRIRGKKILEEDHICNLLLRIYENLRMETVVQELEKIGERTGWNDIRYGDCAGADGIGRVVQHYYLFQYAVGVELVVPQSVSHLQHKLLEELAQVKERGDTVASGYPYLLIALVYAPCLVYKRPDSL